MKEWEQQIDSKDIKSLYWLESVNVTDVSTIRLGGSKHKSKLKLETLREKPKKKKKGFEKRVGLSSVMSCRTFQESMFSEESTLTRPHALGCEHYSSRDSS